MGRQQMVGGFPWPRTLLSPWVFWFWLNGNQTKEGITADLEAMARVGIGGVLLMDVNQGTPMGVEFAGLSEPERAALARYLES